MDLGRILWFNEYKGIGLINHEDGREVFFHYTSVVSAEEKRRMSGGTKVCFDTFKTEMGWEASNVRFF